MDGRNASGRIISLLNESSDVAAALPSSKIQLPPLLHSRTSSCSASSTPSLEPQTPQLVRSSSSDSRTFSTPSPLTPSYTSFDHTTRAQPPKQHQHHQHHQSQQPQQHQHQQHQLYYLANNNPYAKMDESLNSMYPPLPDPSAPMPSVYPMPSHMNAPPQQIQPQQLPNGSTSPASEPSRLSTASAQSNGKAAQPKKNQYPCPMAKQVGCTDFFTTSGHAARHAKKHTGKKDALCPECNKAFTRKDNMEQHRRTHQNGRGSSRTNNDDSKVKKSTKTPSKKASVKPEPVVEAIQQELAAQNDVAAQAQQLAQAADVQAQVQQLPPQTIDQSLLIPAAGPYFLSNTIDPGPISALPMAVPDLVNPRPPLHRSSFANSLEFVPAAPMIDPDALHYSYPSPGLSNGLHSLALAASEHRRMVEKSVHSPSSESSQDGP